MKTSPVQRETDPVALPAGRQLSRLAPALVLLAGVLYAYAPVLRELFRDWIRDPNYHHGFLVPLISIYLIWKQRGRLRATSRKPALLGLLGILAAAALLVVGTAGAEVFTQRVSLIVLLGSSVLFLFGWRHFGLVLFPLAFLLLAIPLPYVIYYSLTGPMQSYAAKFAIWGLKGIGVQAFAQGNIIHLAGTSLEVAEACSGIRSLYAFLALGALVAYATAIPWWTRILVFLVTIPLSIAGNAVRVWGSGLGATLIGPEATHGTIHEFFGLLVFAGSLILFAIFRSIVRQLWSSGTSPPPSSSSPQESMPGNFAPGAPLPARFPRSKDSPPS